MHFRKIEAGFRTWGPAYAVAASEEDAIRQEFPRIKPAVMGGYYITRCDHQTPPAVSIEDYRLYVRLLREFSDEVAAEAKKQEQVV